MFWEGKPYASVFVFSRGPDAEHLNGCPLCDYRYPPDLEDAAKSVHAAEHTPDEWHSVVEKIKNIEDEADDYACTVRAGVADDMRRIRAWMGAG